MKRCFLKVNKEEGKLCILKSNKFYIEFNIFQRLVEFHFDN